MQTKKIKMSRLRALVTGATRGIGRSIAKEFCNQNIDVIGTGTKKGSKLPKGCTYKQVNFLDQQSLDDFILYINDQEIDILVNNAGINKINKFVQVTSDDFDEIIQVNLKSPFLLSQAVLPNMKAKNWGRIVNISSIFGKVSKEFRSPYSMSKFGLDGMTASLAAEVAKDGILVNTLSPGFIDTDLTNRVLGKSGIQNVKKTIPIQRLGSVEEIASFACWLASERNTYISGQNIPIDGGFTRV